MKKMNKKVSIAIALLIFLVLCGGLVFAFLYNKSEPEPLRTTVEKEDTTSKTQAYTYSLTVRDRSGNPVKGVLAAFYDAEGDMINTPLATNAIGGISYTTTEKSNYGSGVLAVPFGYKLDTTIQYFTEETTSLVVVLEDDPAAYVAYIGEEAYLFKDAIAVANEATEDVTITLKGNLTFGQVKIKNANGKNITIDGNGYTVTTLGDYNAIEVQQTKGTITLKNMTINHYDTGTFLRTRTEKADDDISQNLTVNFSNVTLNATNDVEGNYKYCMINLSDAGTTTLNMTKTNIKVKISSKGSNAAVIRTGNAGDKKTVNINLNGCNIDTTEAIGRAGIRVMNDTTANISLKNTTIQTMDYYAVKLNGQKITYTDDCKFSSLDEWYNENPIELPEAKIGETVYTTFKEAIAVANESKDDVTIELLTNVRFTDVKINNSNNKNLTINGNGYKIMTTGTGISFSVEQTEGTVYFNSMTIIHDAKNALIRTRTADSKDTIEQNLALNFTDVKIYAENDQSEYYPWGVFNLADGGNVDLDLTRTDIKMTISTTDAGSNWSVIRVCDAKGQTANITMTDSNIDATVAELRAGIVVMKAGNTSANITLVNSTIKTKNELPIRVLGKAKVYKDSNTSFVVTESEEMTKDPIQATGSGSVNVVNSDVYEAQIGSVSYNAFEDAILAANEFAEDVIIELLMDVEFNEISIENINKKNITINGNGYTITSVAPASGTKIAIDIKQEEGTISFNNMKMVHNSGNALVRTRTASSSDDIAQSLTLNFTDVEIYAENDKSGNYPWGVFNLADAGAVELNLTETDIKMTISSTDAGSDWSVIRVCDVKGQTATITMTNSTIDATEAELRAGIVVMGKANSSADIMLTNSVISTKNELPIRVLGNAIVRKDMASIFAASESVELTNAPIQAEGTGTVNIVNYDAYEAQIGEQKYNSFEEAIAAANESEEDVTIELLMDVALNAVSIDNANDKNITISGNGYTVTTDAPATGTAIAFEIKQEAGTITFNNMTIVHNSGNALVRTRTASSSDNIAQNLTLDFTDVDILAENDKSGNYPWGVFNLADKGTVNLNLTRTDIKMTISSTDAGNKWSVIRVCDVASQTANINMTDSSIDATGAELRAGIAVIGKSSTQANITLMNSTIETKNQYPIYVYGTTENTSCKVTVDEDSTFDVSDNVEMADNPLASENSGTLEVVEFSTAAAKIGTVAYATFEEAIAAANASTTDVVIVLMNDVEFLEVKVNNTNKKNITIDGNGHTITTKSPSSGTKVAFVIEQTEGSITFKNMTIVHNSGNALIRTRTASSSDTIAQNITVNMNDVTINAEKDTSGYYPYGIFNLADSGTVNLNLTRTNIKESISTATGGNNGKYSVIRVDANNQTANITMVDSTIDATGAELRAGIMVNKKTDSSATITLVNSKINTKNQYPIYVYGTATVNKDSKSTFSVSGDTDMSNSPLKAATDGTLQIVAFDTIEAQIGTEAYGTFEDAVTAANASTSDVAIKLLTNVELTVDGATFDNATSKNITIDGCGYTITSPAPTSGTKVAFYVVQTGGTVTFNNMKIVHNSGNALIRTRTASSSDTIAQNITVNMNDVTINAEKDTSGYYPYGIFNLADSGTVNLNLTRTSIKETISTANGGNTGRYTVILVSASNQTATVTLTDSTINATAAELRSGIVIANGSSATITLVNSQIHTKNQYPIYVYKGTATVNKDSKTTFSVSDDADMSNSPIAARSGNGTVTIVNTDTVE